MVRTKVENFTHGFCEDFVRNFTGAEGRNEYGNRFRNAYAIGDLHFTAGKYLRHDIGRRALRALEG